MTSTTRLKKDSYVCALSDCGVTILAKGFSDNVNLGPLGSPRAGGGTKSTSKYACPLVGPGFYSTSG